MPVALRWTTLADGSVRDPVRPLPQPRRMIGQLALAALAVFAIVMVGSSVAASRLAEREAVNDAAHTANVMAVAVVQPVLSDGLLHGDRAAYENLDKVVRANVLPHGIIRVKLWKSDGTIVYADEKRLVGQRFPLDADQLEAIMARETKAEVSDLARSENQFERNGGKLLEVYRPVWTPSGAEMLFEIYGDYTPVESRSQDLWRGFAGLLATSLLLLLVLLAPILWRLVDRLGAAQHQREQLMRSAVDASEQERRRIAADLHDGPVQDLVASSLVVSGAIETVRNEGHESLASHLSQVAATVRGSVASLRSLLVDIYPARLADAGLAAALGDLVRPLAARGTVVDLHTDAAVTEGLTEVQQQVVYRVARECLGNVVKHSGATRVRIALEEDSTHPTHPILLTIDDDGAGFPSGSTPVTQGHFGVRVLTDLARDVGGVLEVASAPGVGVHWRLRLRSSRTRR
ncbi:MAG TPA: histidine kinase [Intrasporangium sp.]|uniref:sensor histidine kinase n=1 Tax=Intrasporangium sp. TaxID=1925024 RepID=UPI002D796064|nr:histidine kinase [Intrasporangium sp.]HET7400038.1 histidine kinase [Intrasporangium sp.]